MSIMTFLSSAVQKQQQQEEMLAEERRKNLERQAEQAALEAKREQERKEAEQKASSAILAIGNTFSNLLKDYTKTRISLESTRNRGSLVPEWSIASPSGSESPQLHPTSTPVTTGQPKQNWILPIAIFGAIAIGGYLILR